MRLFSSGLVALFLFSAAAFSAHATLRLTDDEEIVVESHEVIDDDLIVSASSIRIDGLVKGDLIAFGTNIVIEGIVEEDLIAVGKTVYLNGRVGDDASIGAYALGLGEKARIGDDLFDLSYSLEARPGSAVGGTLHTASRQVLLSGQVVESVLARAGALALRGLTGGDVRAVVGGLEGVGHSQLLIDLALEIPVLPNGLHLGPGAAIGGDLLYRSREPAAVDPGARIDGESRHEDWPPSAAGPIELPSFEPDDSRLRDTLERLAVLLALGLVLAVVVPDWLRARSERIREGPVALLGRGFGALVFGVLMSLLFAVLGMTLLAVAFSLESGSLAGTAVVAGSLFQTALFALFGIALLYVAPVLASAGIGSAILVRFQEHRQDRLAPILDAGGRVVLGVALYATLRAIPVLGGGIAVCASLVGLGALALWLREVFLEND